MMDTCVQAVEWTLDEKTVRIEKNPSINNRVSHFWVKMEIQTVSGKYDCMSHPGTINI